MQLESSQKVDPSLVDVNSFLKSYKAVWDELVDSWLVIQIGDPQVCVKEMDEDKVTLLLYPVCCAWIWFPSKQRLVSLAYVTHKKL